MSRAVSCSFLILSATMLLPMPAHAESRGRAVVGQGAFATDAARPASSPAATNRTYSFPRGRELSAQPPSRFFTEQIWRNDVTMVAVARAEPQQRPIRPRSGNPVEPGALVSRTPSGRVVVGLPAGYILPAPLALPEAIGSRPYAPPQFHMIGTASTRHMDSPVRLTHGVKPPQTLQTGPKVVWFDQAGADDAGGRIRRMR